MMGLYLLRAICMVTSVQAAQLTLGAWFWYTEHTPASWNELMGINYGGFQAELEIPALVRGNDVVSLDLQDGTTYSYMGNVTTWNDGTNADAFITIYANQVLDNGTRGLDLVTDDALVVLAKRLHAYSQTGRQVYARWCPEMNGSWMYYGPPNASAEYYVLIWKKMFTFLRQYAPSVKTVWSPNFDLKSGDTSYWSYLPGPEYVDCVGTSIYFKGNGYDPNIPADYVASSMTTVYFEYAVQYGKPFFISEASGAWEIEQPAEVTQVVFQMEFWQQILSLEFLNTYPLIIGAYIFDFKKQEEFLRDFRVSYDPDVRAMFQTLVQNLNAAGGLKLPAATALQR
ncbi:hypothetical protein HDU83_006670 [Entophlyctis luteolus]|nr:hypothetical protein HDU83_006670 [Entophlyctis luteolus]